MSAIGEVYVTPQGRMLFRRYGNNTVCSLPKGSYNIGRSISYGIRHGNDAIDDAESIGEVWEGNGYKHLESRLVTCQLSLKPYRIIEANSGRIISAEFESSGRSPFSYYRNSAPPHLLVFKEKDNMNNNKYTRLSDKAILTQVGKEDDTGKLIFRCSDGELAAYSPTAVEQILPWCFKMSTNPHNGNFQVFQLPEKPSEIAESQLFVDLKTLRLYLFMGETTYIKSATSAVGRFSRITTSPL